MSMRQQVRACAIGTLVAAVMCSILSVGPVLAAKRAVTLVANWPEDIFESVAEPFERAHADIDVSLTAGGTSKVLALVAAGMAPDLQIIGPESYPEFARKGLLQPYNELLARDNVSLNSLYKPAVEEYRQEGKLYGIPVFLHTLFLLYSPSLLDNAGINHPSSNWNDPSWTLDAFVDRARKLTRVGSGGQVEQWGFGRRFEDFMLPFLFGGRFLKPDWSGLALDEPASLRGFEFQADLIHVHGVSPSPGAQGAAGIDFYDHGKAAITLIASGDLVSRAKSGVDSALAAIPHAPGLPPVTMILPDAVRLYRDSKEQEAAWEFVKYLLSSEAQNRLSEQFATIPAVTTLARQWLHRTQPRLPGMDLMVAINGVEYGVARVFGPQPLGKQVWAALEPIWTGQKPARQVIEGIMQFSAPMFAEWGR